MADAININSANTLKLSEPITLGSEVISVLEFNKPTVADIRKLGYPMYFSDAGDLKINADVAAKYISKLCCLPPSTVDKMSIQDFTEAIGIISSFFGNGG